MKKSALITIDFLPNIGGVSRYWDRVCKSMPAQQLDIITNLEYNNPNYPQKIYTIPFFFKSFIWPKWLKGVFSLAKHFSMHSYKHIFVAQLLPIGTIVYILSFFYKFDYTVQLYGMDIKQALTHSRKSKLAKIILKKAKHIIVNSESTKFELEKLGKYASVQVIYPIPDSKTTFFNNDSIKSTLEQKYQFKNKFTVLTVARHVRRKGIDYTIQSVKELSKKYPQLQYIITSTGPDTEHLKKLANDAKNIHFVGKISDKELSAFYDLSDVFCMPVRTDSTDIEGFGMVYLEANYHDLPVIAGNGGGAKEAVIHEKNGIVINSSDQKELMNKLEWFITHPHKTKEFGLQAKEFVKKQFDWELSIKELLSRLSL